LDIRVKDNLSRLTVAGSVAQVAANSPVKTFDSQENVTRIVEELKNDAAERRRRLTSIANAGKEKADSHSDNYQILPEAFAPPLTFASPFADKNQIRYPLQELLAYDDREFVHNAYHAILKRPPDPKALVSALEGLRSAKFDKIDILLDMTASLESRQKGVHISGLRSHRFARTLCRLPLVRHIANPVYGLFQWRSYAREQQRSQALVFTQQQRLVEFLNDNHLVLQDSLRLLEEQKQRVEVLFGRLGELTRYAEERLNEETMQRQQQFTDRTAEIEDVRRVYNKYRTQVELTEKDLKREMDHLFRKYQEVKTELVYQKQRLASLEQGTGSIATETIPSSGNDRTIRAYDLDPFFASFDEHFRGDRQKVKQRLRTYLPLIREYGAGNENAPILDVACGRGEWLELLKEENLRAIGFDTNSVLVSQCREGGLDVVQSELIQYLHGVADGSLGAVSAFHIVEHLSVEDLIAFLDHTLRVLRVGGLLLLETPNPENVLVGSCNFYFDPTHRNPIPSPVLKFLVESRGFVIVQVFELNPSDEKPLTGDSELVRRFNQYFYGPMDYAIVARKV
jgi:ubiquinone/menaquinone biosynthesis C-methylase UbiE